MNKLRHILEHVVYRLDDASLAQHYLVIKGHQTLFHVRAQTGHNMYAVILEMSEKRLGYISFVCVKFAEHFVSQRVNDILAAVVHVGAGKYKVDQLPFLVAEKMLPLMEQILSPANLNAAYLQVKRNGGAAGVDRMSCERLLGYLIEHGEELKESIRQRTYRPNPVRRVEIPKDNGKKRQLGIPTVVDRMIQQAIAQVLTPIYERQFSDGSYGFRPRRGAHGALVKACEIANKGYHYAVDIDLERFFDTVDHSKLIELLRRTIKDNAVISLIHRYLNAGVMTGGRYEATREGTPQGGPLSPLLANILLNELDKELERRGHPFVRYADDGLIFCKSRRAAERVRDSITRFIESRLKLRVNREKTECAYIGRLKFLGYGFYIRKGKCRLRLHQKSEAKMRRRLKEITSRSNGMGYQRRKDTLRQYLRGRTEYYRLADMGTKVKEIDQWLRRRIRMCIWKSWKRCKTRTATLYGVA